MIFTLGSPDLYILPGSVSGSTHAPAEEALEGSLAQGREDPILAAKTSFCRNYVFILTKRVLYAYSNGSEFVYLGRIVLADLQFSEASSFRGLVILPVPNLIGLLVDNQKHLLVVNYQNPTLSETVLSKTPVQTPTNCPPYPESETSGTPKSASGATAQVAPTPATPTPVSSAPISAIVNNRLVGAANIGSMLNRILHPSDNEQVDELRDTFDVYLKNFLNFRLVYDILVPSAFSLVFVLNRQFLFWIEEQSGLYSTIAEEGFLNVLINHFNSLKRRNEEVRRISLYLVTTNLLNNMNIIGNIHLSYGLCYINLQSIIALSNRRKKSDPARESENLNIATKLREYRNLQLRSDFDSLFTLIYDCIGKINNTRPDRLVASQSPPAEPALEQQQLLNTDNSIDANTILEMLELQEETPKEALELDASEAVLGEMEGRLAVNLRNFAMADNYLFLLTTSNVLMYLHVHSPDTLHSLSPLSSDSEDRSDSAEGKDSLGQKTHLLGMIAYSDVDNIYVGESQDLLCILFGNNTLRTFHTSDLSRPIAELELQKEVDDVYWLKSYLIVLTNDEYLHFCSYSLQRLYSTSLNDTGMSFGQNFDSALNTFAGPKMPSNTSTGSITGMGSPRSGDSYEESDPATQPEAPPHGRLLGISNNLRLLVYSDKLLVRNLHVDYSGRSPFSIFLNNNSILILSNFSFFSPTRSVNSAVNSGVNKDILLLKLPNLNALEKEEEEDEGDQPYGIELIEDIKINNTGNYVLIHHCNSASTGSPSSTGIILYNNNKYVYPTSNTHNIVGINWFTNHIFYITALVQRAEPPGSPKESDPANNHQAPSSKSYKIVFYSINNLNELIIEIKLRNRPVCTCIDKPYLFVLLDEAGQVFCYDLFYIQYKLLYSFNLDDLLDYKPPELDQELASLSLNGQDAGEAHRGTLVVNQRPPVGASPGNWVEMHVFGHKKFLLLNVYGQLYVLSDTHIQHLLDNVTRIVHNNSDNPQINREYLVFTREGTTYLLYNHEEQGSDPSEEGRVGSGEGEAESGCATPNTESQKGAWSILGSGHAGMVKVNVMNHNGYVLSMTNSILLCLNFARSNIGLSSVLMPGFLHYQVQGSGPDSCPKEVPRPRCSRMFLLENLIYQFNLLKAEADRKRFLAKIDRQTRTKLFAIACRKQNELDKITLLEQEFELDSEACFNALLADSEFEFASILLLPLQTKTDPYFVRARFCRRLVDRLLETTIAFTPQKGTKTRRSNQALVSLLVKFYNRIHVGDDYELQKGFLDASRSSAEILRLAIEEEEPGPDRGIAEVIDMGELKRRLLSALDFNAIYQLAFLNTEDRPHYDLVEDAYFPATPRPQGSSVGAPEDGGVDADAAGADTSPEPSDLDSNGLGPLELNAILYFLLEFNHSNCAITTAAGAARSNCDNWRVVGTRVLFCMLVGYANYLGLTDLVLNDPDICEYVSRHLKDQDNAGADHPGRSSLLRRLLLRVKNTYTLI